MKQHDKGLLKYADVPRFHEWLRGQSIETRAGKGEYQLMQVKVGNTWPAICFDKNKEVTTPPALNGLIRLFYGEKPAVKAPAKKAEDKAFLADLRDDFAMAALQGMLAHPVQFASGPDMLARDAYTLADAMLLERAK